MTEHPKFTCRRKGHVVPILTATATIPGVTFVVVCTRCGYAVEQPVPVKESA